MLEIGDVGFVEITVKNFVAFADCLDTRSRQALSQRCKKVLDSDKQLYQVLE